MGDGRINGKHGNRFAGLLSGLTLLLAAAAAVGAQDGWVTESVIPERIEADTVALFRIKIFFADASLVTVDDLELPEGLEIESGPFIRPVRLEGKTVIEYSIAGEKPGRYLIPPLTIHLPEWDWQTRPLALFVGSKDRSDPVPIDLLWQVPFVQMYRGQALPVTLWTDMIETTELGIDLDIPSPPDVLVRPIQRTVDPFRMGTVNMELYRSVFASYMYILPEAGLVDIPPRSLQLGSVTARLPALQLYAYPLPEPPPDLPLSGMGIFTSVYSLEQEQVQDFSLVTLRMTYSGEGNFILLRFPEPRTEHLQVLRREEKNEYEPLFSFPYGYSGRKTRTVTYRQLDGNAGKLSIPDTVTFNPVTGLYDLQKGLEANIGLQSAGTGISTVETVPIPELPSAGEIGRLRIIRLYSDGRVYLLFLPPFLLFLAGIFLPRRKQGGVIGAALLVLVLFHGCAPEPHRRDSPADGPGLFREGLESIRRDDPGSALHAFRGLHRFRPMDTVVIDAVKTAEEFFEIDRQVPVRRRLHPDIPLTAGLGFCYVFAILFFLRRRRNMRMPVVPLVLMFCALGIFAYSVRALSIPVGVVKSEAALLVIPEPEGKQKLKLGAGTTVFRKKQWEEYIQVQTGDGTLGWLHKNDLWL